MSMHVISRSAIKRDPGALGALDEHGGLKVMPASFYREFSAQELMAFCVLQGVYSLPTFEMVDWLRTVIGDRSVLEIGSGNGVLAKTMDIRATDNWMQTWPEIVAYLQSCGQAAVKYGAWVENLDAHAAIARYQPQVVLACWVTHQFREDRAEAGGNMFGVEEEKVLRECQTYIHIGNSKTHAGKSIRQLPHRRYRFDWLLSRTMQQDLNEISIWGARLPGEPPEA